MPCLCISKFYVYLVSATYFVENGDGAISGLSVYNREFFLVKIIRNKFPGEQFETEEREGLSRFRNILFQ